MGMQWNSWVMRQTFNFCHRQCFITSEAKSTAPYNGCFLYYRFAVSCNRPSLTVHLNKLCTSYCLLNCCEWKTNALQKMSFCSHITITEIQLWGQSAFLKWAVPSKKFPSCQFRYLKYVMNWTHPYDQSHVSIMWCPIDQLPLWQIRCLKYVMS
jgi:hypothetical protein